MTYDNECFAHVAGMSVANDGPCPDLPPPVCDDDADGDRICDADDMICNLDFIPQNCRRLTPECPPGEVPQMIDGCYNDLCTLVRMYAKPTTASSRAMWCTWST